MFNEATRISIIIMVKLVTWFGWKLCRGILWGFLEFWYDAEVSWNMKLIANWKIEEIRKFEETFRKIEKNCLYVANRELLNFPDILHQKIVLFGKTFKIYFIL